jgi:hypothetical protein
VCTLLPLGCALRDNHAGGCMSVRQLDHAVDTAAAELWWDIDPTLPCPPHIDDKRPQHRVPGPGA